MSLVEFKASNHPQQTGRRGARDVVDDRGTTPEVFDPLHARFGFTLDVAAAPHNAKCDRYFTIDDDGLQQPWAGEVVWANPPYSDIRPWVEKAWEEWGRPGGPRAIVMLLPNNRCEQSWWMDLVEPHRDRPGSDLHVEFLRGRPRFERPGAVIGPKGDRPPFGCCLLILGGDDVTRDQLLAALRVERYGPTRPEEAPMIQAVPKVYRGTRFRSTLEADWAATFDHLGWFWEYEPMAVKLPDGSYYRPDFRLPAQRVWAEVKGPHNERIKKPELLQRATYVEDEEWTRDSDLVVVLRPPGPGEMAQWEGALHEQDMVIVHCPDCLHYSFMDHNGIWTCRRQISEKPMRNKFWTEPGGALYWPGELPFIRADDPRRAA